MKRARPIAPGILIGLVLGLIYGYSVLASTVYDTHTGIVVGGLMGSGLAGAIVLALQSQGRYGG